MPWTFNALLNDMVMACLRPAGLAACSTTHLIFKTHAGVLDSSKFRTAQQWGIPVVHWQWLLDSVDRRVNGRIEAGCASCIPA